MSEALQDYPIFHAGCKPVMHPRLGVEIAGQTSIRYMRFLQPVRIDRLELPYVNCGRWVPVVPSHPAHLTVSLLNRQGTHWETFRDVDLRPNPVILGKGLSQRMSIAEVEAAIAGAIKGRKHTIDLGGVKTDCLRVECDREHPVWPSHGECNGGEFNVPFRILEPLKAYGKPSRTTIEPPPYNPVLSRGVLKPKAPKGMRLEQRPGVLMFRGAKLAIGFSLTRPLLLHLGWDHYGRGQADANRLLAVRKRQVFSDIGGLSGPLLRTPFVDAGDFQWTGKVEARGNRVYYRDLHTSEELTVDAVFTVSPEEILLELVQTCHRPIPALEAEAWRFVWGMCSRMTGSVSHPTLRPGRNGDLNWPILFAGDGNGCLLCELIEGAPAAVCLQTESYRKHACRTDGFSLAEFPQPGRLLILPAGTRRAAIRLSVTDLSPATRTTPLEGTKRNWSAAFTAFRPEYGGFSNNAISINCHVNQHVTADMIVFTKCPKAGPNPLHLARFTLERALLDGGGYGYHRSLYMDSDPILLSGIGRLHQLAPDRRWLERVSSGVVETTRRILGTIGREGLAICRTLSGNSRSFRWSSNAFDVVGYGHMDAYVNAWTYRALKNAAVLLKASGQTSLAGRCREKAIGLREAYPKQLVNPRTGWVAGWRSRDGTLHDYAFLWVNGPALAFGLLPLAAARKALENLERLRLQLCPDGGYYGLPCNLRPIHCDDHMLPKLSSPTAPTFEFYTDGSLMAVGMGYYLRALSIHGMRKSARRLAKELDRGFADGVFCGPYGSGPEFHTWDGMDSGYEGVFGPTFGMLYAVAVETGAMRPPEPEWWPEA